MTLDLDAIRARYDRAIEAKPSKGDYTADGIAAIDVILNHSGRLGVHYADVARACAEAIHKLYPTCQPSREVLAEALDPWVVTHHHGCHGDDDWGSSLSTKDGGELADAALALLPGRSESEVKAEALREAAPEAEFEFRSMTFFRGGGSETQLHAVGDWLRRRADRLTGGEQ